jgi:hypothetical protein
MSKFNRVNKRDVPTNPERKVAKSDFNKRGTERFLFSFLFRDLTPCVQTMPPPSAC